MTTSDFPEIVSNTANKSLRVGYSAAPAVMKSLARQVDARDFKPQTRLLLDGSNGLTPELVSEHGEYRRGNLVEAKESWSVATMGKIVPITRQLLVNDDTGAFGDVPRKLGQAAAAFEAQFLVDLLESNPVLSDDSTALFHGDHGNLATANLAAPSEAGLTAARIAMRSQTSKDGALINIAPKYLLHNAAVETSVEKLLASIYAATSDDANVFAQRITPLCEPRLAVNKWYVVGDPAMCDGLEYGYLQSSPGPQIENRVGFEVDGIEIKIRLDFGAGFIEHRNWYQNPGTGG